jgi:hypothetical protein
MGSYAYRPRLGYDIRVRPPLDEAAVFSGPKMRPCEAPGCLRKAAVPAARSPRAPHPKLWLCAEHARTHNAAWNFFDGLSEPDAEAARRAADYGDRPTWAMGGAERLRAAARSRGAAEFRDAFGLFYGLSRPGAGPGRMRNGRLVPKLQAQAFRALGLKATAAGPEIRRRYADLVRRYHPDANGGDRSAEGRLAEVVKAHHLLKKAGYC